MLAPAIKFAEIAARDQVDEGLPGRCGNRVGSQYYMEGAAFDAAGKRRIEHMRTLKKNFEDNGIEVEVVIVPDAGHDQDLMFPAMREFAG